MARKAEPFVAFGIFVISGCSSTSDDASTRGGSDAAAGAGTSNGGTLGTGGGTLGVGGVATSSGATAGIASGGADGNGGSSTHGGAKNDGGASGSGGVPNSGGVSTTGGANALGGTTGGTPATGGVSASGGTNGSGGAAATGGASATGGTTATGGTSATGGAGGGTGLYPLSVSANQRYLVTASGAPFLTAGDAPQCLSARLSPANTSDYFTLRAGQGFNAAWVNLLCTTYTGGKADGTTYDDIAPFTGTTGDGRADITKPNESYFARIDALLETAASNGIVVFLDPIETGGFLDTLRSNGSTAARTYGRYLGSRYAATDNIVWMSGNDFRAWQSSSDDALVLEVALGIRDNDTRHLQTVELDWPTYMSSLDDTTWQSILGVNLTYTYYPTYAELYVDYNRSSHLPSVMIEANYEGENLEQGSHVTNAHDIRTQYYWSNLSGATGSFYGNHWEVFALDNSTWRSNLAGDRGAPQVAHVQALFGSRKWYELVPDQNHTVVTAGYGDFEAGGNAQDNTYATTARTADGALVMTYMPTARAVTVDMTTLADRVVARWFDPTNGAYSDIAGSPFDKTGSKTFAPPSAKHSDGYDDWVLVLETVPP